MSRNRDSLALRVTIKHEGDRTLIALSGRVDESGAAQLSAAFEELRSTVCLNLREVTLVSSYGIGLLMRHLGAISRSHKVEFAECSESMVDQFQMLEFSSYGRITSFVVRYVCGRCDRQETYLIDIERDLEVEVETRTIRSPEYKCACGGKLIADDSLDFVIEHLPG